MENKYNTSERGTQILLSLLKAHGINKVIASPGTANMALVASMQHDDFFTIYSSIDERSAAYMACGLAAESGEPVVLTCTEATASRNYMPGLTEAYYRKLPVLAVTCSHGEANIGHLAPQVIDRRNVPNDIANLSVRIPKIKDAEDEWSAVIKLNTAVLELTHRGGGPVHIDLTATYSRDFSVKELPHTRVISRFTSEDELPKLVNGKVGIFVGSHCRFTDELTEKIDLFCENHNAVVLCDQSSNYYGHYRINYSVICSQEKYRTGNTTFDLIIHIGEVSGEYWHVNSHRTWRVNPDGVLRDLFKSLTAVFEMKELTFFNHYSTEDVCENTLYRSMLEEQDAAHMVIKDLPLSNCWIAQTLHDKIPNDSIVHMGILNSLRAWNFFDSTQTFMTSCNVGGFGIDGCLSTMIGSSLANPDKLHFAFLGDLAFFYDMNSLGNRHVGNNVRILLVNNGKGTEFRMYWHPAYQFGEEADSYIAAGGHYGDKSPMLVKAYVEALGFEYLSASNKEEFMNNTEKFISPNHSSRPIVFEVFTNSDDENKAVEIIRNSLEDSGYKMRNFKNKVVTTIVGESGKQAIKKILGK